MGFSTLDTLEHDTSRCLDTSLIKIDSTHFALAYRGVDLDGFLKTFSIDGSFNITEEDSLEYDTDDGDDPSLILVDSTHFALAHRGTDQDGFVRTFSIDGSFNITSVDSLEHDTVQGLGNKVVLIDSTHFALTYYNLGTDRGYVKTFSLDGSFNITEEDSVEISTNSTRPSGIELIDGTHLLITYSDVDDETSHARTYSLDGSYDLTVVDTVELSEYVFSSGRSLRKVDSTHFFLVAQENTTEDLLGFVLEIDGSYNLTELKKVTLDASAEGSFFPSVDSIDANNYIVGFSGQLDDGFIKKVEIDDSYNISVTGGFEFDASQGDFISVVAIDSTHFIVAYQGVGDDGFIKTFLLSEEDNEANNICVV